MDRYENGTGEGVGETNPRRGDGGSGRNDQGELTFEFPVVAPNANVQMKIIRPLVLPHFHGKVHKDPDAFSLSLKFCVEVMITL